MTGDQKLKKANQALKSELEDLRQQIQKLSEELTKKTEHSEQDDSHGAEFLSPGRSKSVEFVSAKYDELVAFKSYATEELQKINSRLNTISEACDRIEKAVDTFEAYSYQFNIKITGMPPVTEHEDAEETTNLCLQLFKAIGVGDISINDIDIAHRVPPRKPSNRPSAIICKFTRRLAKDKVMAARKEVRNVHADQFDYEHDEVDLSHINLYDHLTPRLQTLLFEAKKIKAAKNFEFCWVKNGLVRLRETKTSPILKFSDMEQLDAWIIRNQAQIYGFSPQS